MNLKVMAIMASAPFALVALLGYAPRSVALLVLGGLAVWGAARAVQAFGAGAWVVIGFLIAVVALSSFAGGKGPVGGSGEYWRRR